MLSMRDQSVESLKSRSLFLDYQIIERLKELNYFRSVWEMEVISYSEAKKRIKDTYIRFTHLGYEMRIGI